MLTILACDAQYGEGVVAHYCIFIINECDRGFPIDHLHPKVRLKVDLKSEFLKAIRILAFYSDTKHWNSIANLHLLNDSQNLSKLDTPLIDWVNNKNTHVTSADLLVDGVSLELDAFKNFYEKRRIALRDRLISRVFITTSLSEAVIPDDTDEEVVEELIL
jgi:hypothetical protein